jgi:dTDP-4-dehydrorhamnose reductase
MKILLLGKDGQVGWELQRALAPLGDVVALGRGGNEGFVGDLADEAGLRAMVATVSPDVIINAGAYTNFDRAETEPELVYRINARGPGVLAEEAAARGIWLVHYSTDYVFDNDNNNPRREEDVARPLSVYGKTKHAGDEAIQSSGCRHLVLRVSWVYATHGDNFVRRVLKLADERECVTVVSDQIGAPTGADLIADVTAHLVRSVTSDLDGRRSGLYHLAASGEVSRYEYALFLLEEARRRRGVGFKAREIVPSLSSALPSAASRPLNSRLDTTRLRNAFGIHLPDWRAGVQRMLDEIL